MIWKRTLLIGLLTIAGLSLETAVFGEMTLAGTKPPLLLLVTVTVAMGEGAAAGMTAGFVAGLCLDLASANAVGVTALVYTVVGYVVGVVRAQFQTPSVRLPVAITLVATALGLLLYGGVAAILGMAVDGGATLRHALIGGVYNALLTPFVFPVVRQLGRRLRPVTVR